MEESAAVLVALLSSSVVALLRVLPWEDAAVHSAVLPLALFQVVSAESSSWPATCFGMLIEVGRGVPRPP